MKDVEPIRQVSFESIRHMDEGGNEFWYARELCKALGYAKWDSFEKVVNRAILSLTNNSTGINVDAHFNRIKRPVRIGYEAGNTTREIDDFVLSRYACYIIAQNGNPASKPRVAEAQNYFATQTRKREIETEVSSSVNRLARRNEFTESDKHLSANMVEVGISPRGIATVKGSGDKVFFGGKTGSEIKDKYGLKPSKPWANRAPNVLLAGKTFANELTASSIVRGVTSFNDIKNDNDANNSEVRKTIIAQSGQAPEDFEPAEDTEKIRRRLKSHYGITDASRKNLRSGEDGSNV